MKEMKTNNKGFSLVELIVVVAIMAVLMVVLAPAMLRYVEKTRVQKDDSAASEVLKAVELALADEPIYEEAKGGDITVTITGSSGALGFNNAAGATALLEKEVKATVGDTIKITSKDRGGKTCTIKAEYSSTRQTYVVKFDDAAGTVNGWK
ncbi:MAG: type II secretion system protein [Agathobacter sp.]|nr:type II secretion system protein [Agathobacter sp.]